MAQQNEGPQFWGHGPTMKVFWLNSALDYPKNSRSFFIHQELQSKKGIKKKKKSTTLPAWQSESIGSQRSPTHWISPLQIKPTSPFLFSYIPTWSLHFQHPFLQGWSFKSEDPHVFHTSGIRWLVQASNFLWSTGWEVWRQKICVYGLLYESFL